MSQISAHKLKIGIIGCGNMGSALVENLAGTLGPEGIRIFDKETSKIESLVRGFKVRGAESVQEVVEKSDIVVVAVKPQDIDDVLVFLKGRKDKLVVSIAAGKTLRYLASQVGPGVALVRGMPNLNAIVQASMTGSAMNPCVTQAQKNDALQIFRSIGSVVVIEEGLMNAFTALAGSGPAFIARLKEDIGADQMRSVFLKEAVAFGFDAPTAKLITEKTMEGTEKILRVNFDKEIFIKRVSSKGGTTEAGIRVLEEKGRTIDGLSLAIRAARQRADELSKD